MLQRMSVVLTAIAVTALLYFVLRARARKNGAPEAAHDSTPAIDGWIADSLEVELAERVLGLKASTPDERRGVAKSLRGDPDPDVVSKIEDAVKGVELEYVRYAHEADAELVLKVRYEDGQSTTLTKRLPWTEVPEAVRSDFDRRGATRVFRSWPMPWSRAHAL
jgi:hypothetical protein